MTTTNNDLVQTGLAMLVRRTPDTIYVTIQTWDASLPGNDLGAEDRLELNWRVPTDDKRAVDALNEAHGLYLQSDKHADFPRLAAAIIRLLDPAKRVQ